MKIRYTLLLFILAVLLVTAGCAAKSPLIQASSKGDSQTVRVEVQQVCFSPNGNSTAAIIEQMDDAKSEILIQAYSFTSAPIAKALVNAHERGVKVEAILDKSQRSKKYTSDTFLLNEGIPIYIDSMHAIAHNKIIIIDKEIVITGSFNFTKAAEEKNAENLLIINSKELAKIYLENWKMHKEHSEEYHERN